ncbi:Programmed cell death protein 10 [Intoshia linei]|uniref:Programmed cell death protein 10 n=1 Tax=Intoshia linei TaxID=1819745 RepID=A0A177B648_9BILA|nr:Programmed cell death protein 10 [Intoshia linei]
MVNYNTIIMLIFERCILSEAVNKLKLSDQQLKNIKTAFRRALSNDPSLIVRLTSSLLVKAEVTKNLDLSQLVLLADNTKSDSSVLKILISNYYECFDACIHLRQILRDLPRYMHYEKTLFFENIKKIASYIQKMLGLIKIIMKESKHSSTNPEFELRKNELIETSRQFSKDLKTYFHKYEDTLLHKSACHLLFETYRLQECIYNCNKREKPLCKQ